MADLTAELRAALSASSGVLLVGWIQIAGYCKKSPRSLRRYRQLAAFPVYRWGRFVYSDTRMISTWLHIYAEERAKHKLSRT